ncbi:MAG: zinc-ribbon domain-containing protein [Acidobacteriaceae bacterium]
MQCPACSTENPAGATFCQHCGASLTAAPPPPAGGYTQVPQPATGPAGAAYVPAQSGLSDNAAGAIAYLTFIPAIIFLVIEPYSKKPFVRFHAMQCIGLTLASVVIHFAIALLVVVLHGFTFMLSSLVSLGFFVLWLICIVSAAQGKWFKVPVIGDFAQQQASK